MFLSCAHSDIIVLSVSTHVTRTKGKHKLVKSQKLLMMQYDFFFIPYLIIFGTHFSKVLLPLQAQSNILK